MDYSKWDKLESDDEEEETLININRLLESLKHIKFQADESFEVAEKSKNQSDYFKSIQKYEELCSSALDHVRTSSHRLANKEMITMLISGLLNSATCYLKLLRWSETIIKCNLVLDYITKYDDILKYAKDIKIFQLLIHTYYFRAFAYIKSETSNCFSKADDDANEMIGLGIKYCAGTLKIPQSDSIDLEHMLNTLKIEKESEMNQAEARIIDGNIKAWELLSLYDDQQQGGESNNASNSSSRNSSSSSSSKNYLKEAAMHIDRVHAAINSCCLSFTTISSSEEISGSNNRQLLKEKFKWHYIRARLHSMGNNNLLQAAIEYSAAAEVAVTISRSNTSTMVLSSSAWDLTVCLLYYTAGCLFLIEGEDKKPTTAAVDEARKCFTATTTHISSIMETHNTPSMTAAISTAETLPMQKHKQQQLSNCINDYDNDDDEKEEDIDIIIDSSSNNNTTTTSATTASQHSSSSSSSLESRLRARSQSFSSTNSPRFNKCTSIKRCSENKSDDDDDDDGASSEQQQDDVIIISICKQVCQQFRSFLLLSPTVTLSDKNSLVINNKGDISERSSRITHLYKSLELLAHLKLCTLLKATSLSSTVTPLQLPTDDDVTFISCQTRALVYEWLTIVTTISATTTTPITSTTTTTTATSPPVMMIVGIGSMIVIEENILQFLDFLSNTYAKQCQYTIAKSLALNLIDVLNKLLQLVLSSPAVCNKSGINNNSTSEQRQRWIKMKATSLRSLGHIILELFNKSNNNNNNNDQTLITTSSSSSSNQHQQQQYVHQRHIYDESTVQEVTDIWEQAISDLQQLSISSSVTSNNNTNNDTIEYSSADIITLNDNFKTISKLYTSIAELWSNLLSTDDNINSNNNAMSKSSLNSKNDTSNSRSTTTTTTSPTTSSIIAASTSIDREIAVEKAYESYTSAAKYLMRIVNDSATKSDSNSDSINKKTICAKDGNSDVQTFQLKLDAMYSLFKAALCCECNNQTNNNNSNDRANKCIITTLEAAKSIYTSVITTTRMTHQSKQQLLLSKSDSTLNKTIIPIDLLQSDLYRAHVDISHHLACAYYRVHKFQYAYEEASSLCATLEQRREPQQLQEQTSETNRSTNKFSNIMMINSNGTTANNTSSSTVTTTITDDIIIHAYEILALSSHALGLLVEVESVIDAKLRPLYTWLYSHNNSHSSTQNNSTSSDNSNKEIHPIEGPVLATVNAESNITSYDTIGGRDVEVKVETEIKRLRTLMQQTGRYTTSISSAVSSTSSVTTSSIVEGQAAVLQRGLISSAVDSNNRHHSNSGGSTSDKLITTRALSFTEFLLQWFTEAQTEIYALINKCQQSLSSLNKGNADDDDKIKKAADSNKKPVKANHTKTNNSSNNNFLIHAVTISLIVVLVAIILYQRLSLHI